MLPSTRAVSGWKLLLALIVSFVIALTSLPLANIAAPADAASSSGYRFKRSERCLMRRINAVRARHGLHRFEADKQLSYVARRHAVAMSGTGSTYHDPDIGWKVTRWRRLGQNTGSGRSCRSLARSFLNSYEHRRHILGRFRFIGLGTQKRGGRLYVQELFESRRNPGNVYHYP